MPQLLVRNLSEETVRKIKDRARKHGRSVEAEHRAILEGTPEADERTGADVVDAYKGLTFLSELDLEDLRSNDPPRTFDPEFGAT